MFADATGALPDYTGPCEAGGGTKPRIRRRVGTKSSTLGMHLIGAGAGGGGDGGGGGGGGGDISGRFRAGAGDNPSGAGGGSTD